MKVLTIMCCGYPLYINLEIYSGVLRACGDVWLPMIITALGVCVTRILWILIMFPKYTFIQTIIYAYPISWGLTSILFFIYMHKFSKSWKWMKTK